MTVPPSARRADLVEAAAPSRTAPVTGSFWSPRGPAGTFGGSYRLERLLDQFGQTAAAGVFTGELVGADRQRLGTASRRHTAAAELAEGPDGFLARVGPVDVNLLGFLVTVTEFTVVVPRDLPAGVATPLPASAAEMLGQVVSAAGSGPTGPAGAEHRDTGGR
jgi:hypothetical protein